MLDEEEGDVDEKDPLFGNNRLRSPLECELPREPVGASGKAIWDDEVFEEEGDTARPNKEAKGPVNGASVALLVELLVAAPFEFDISCEGVIAEE